MRKVTLSVIIWRLLLFVPLLFLRYLPRPQDLRYFGISPWANFDGDHYLAIAMHGYDASVARFFPLYPIIIKIIANPFSRISNPYYTFIIGMFVSNLSFLAACLILYKLLRTEYSYKTSFWTIIFLLVFPTSFFFGSIYAESLFLLLTVLSFYLVRKRKWLLAILSATLLPITRSVGLVILPALFIEWFLQQKEKNKPPSIIILLSLFLIPLSLIGYAFFNFIKFKDWLYFVHAQTELSNGRSSSIILIPQTLFRYGKMLITVPITQYIWHIVFLELAMFFFAAILLYIAYIKKIRLSYLAFAILAFLIPTSTGTFTGLPRYVIVLFPMFIALALIKNKRIKIIYMIASIIISFILLLLFTKGYYVA